MKQKSINRYLELGQPLLSVSWTQTCFVLSWSLLENESQICIILHFKQKTFQTNLIINAVPLLWAPYTRVFYICKWKTIKTTQQGGGGSLTLAVSTRSISMLRSLFANELLICMITSWLNEMLSKLIRRAFNLSVFTNNYIANLIHGI